MSNPNEPRAEPDSFNDLPIQPTGSGVADLEIAFEQMKLSEEEGEAVVSVDEGANDPFRAANDAEAESEGHPS